MSLSVPSLLAGTIVSFSFVFLLFFFFPSSFFFFFSFRQGDCEISRCFCNSTRSACNFCEDTIVMVAYGRAS